MTNRRGDGVAFPGNGRSATWTERNGNRFPGRCRPRSCGTVGTHCGSSRYGPMPSGWNSPRRKDFRPVCWRGRSTDAGRNGWPARRSGQCPDHPPCPLPKQGVDPKDRQRCDSRIIRRLTARQPASSCRGGSATRMGKTAKCPGYSQFFEPERRRWKARENDSGSGTYAAGTSDRKR